MSPRRFTALLLLLASSAARAGDAERDRIKKARFEIVPIPFRVPSGINPFVPLLPMKTASVAAKWKVRIASLQMTSVLVGRRKVAIFKESHGPSYPYVLVNGTLVGPDHKPVPGIAGSIESGSRRGEYHVTLRQGAESIEFIKADVDADAKTAARLVVEQAAGSDRNPE